MTIAITYRHLEHEDAYRKNIEEKISRVLEKYRIKVTSVSVILEKRKRSYYAEVVCQGKNFEAVGHSESDKNIYVAIDEAVTKTEVQLKRHKEKIHIKKTKTKKEEIV